MIKWKLPEKTPFYCMLIAAAGVLVLALMPRAAKQQARIETAQQEDTAAYVAQLEQKLTAMLSGIDGVSELSVMVTLQSGIEYVYATERKTNVNLLSDTLSNAQKRVENTNGNEDSYIILKDSSGNETAVLLKRLEPIVQGVAVVCRGADDNVIRQKLLETTAVALGLPTNRVSVVSK